jgi:hypothetical protein
VDLAAQVAGLLGRPSKSGRQHVENLSEFAQPEAMGVQWTSFWRAGRCWRDVDSLSLHDRKGPEI